MSEWRPIESAPMGEWIFLAGIPWESDYPPITVGRGTLVTEKWWERVSDTRQELRSETKVEWDCDGLVPEYWLPLTLLPSPPKD